LATELPFNESACHCLCIALAVASQILVERWSKAICVILLLMNIWRGRTVGRDQKNHKLHDLEAQRKEAKQAAAMLVRLMVELL
jgi:hypothetical protein